MSRSRRNIQAISAKKSATFDASSDSRRAAGVGPVWAPARSAAAASCSHSLAGCEASVKDRNFDNGPKSAVPVSPFPDPVAKPYRRSRL